MWLYTVYTDGQAIIKTGGVLVACCTYPFNVIDLINMQIRTLNQGQPMQCESYKSDQSGLMTNPSIKHIKQISQTTDLLPPSY